MKGIDLNRKPEYKHKGVTILSVETFKRRNTQMFQENVLEVYLKETFPQCGNPGWIMDPKYANAVLNRYFKDV